MMYLFATSTLTMAVLEAATQPARVHGRVKPGHPAPSDSLRSRTLACWVAGSSPAMVNEG
jgi:hypothetical protein